LKSFDPARRVLSEAEVAGHLTISLRTRVVLLIGLLAGAIAVVPAIYLPEVLESQSRRWVESRYLDVTRAVAAVAEAPLEFDDARGAADALAALGRTPGAAYARLLRADGGPLAAWQTAPGGSPVPARDGAVAYGGDLLHLRVDISARGGGRGSLVAGFHLHELEERRKEATAVVWRTTAVALAVAVAGAVLLGTLLMKPLRRVTDLAARIAGGDEGAAGLLAELERGDETGKFAASLGKVVERLAEQRTLLESLSEASSEAILTLAPDGKVLFHNHRLAELVGAGHGPALATWAAVRDRLRPLLALALPDWLEADRPALPGSRAEPFQLRLRKGTLLEVYAAEVATRSGASRGLGLYLRDISRLSDAEGSVQALQASLEKQVGEIASQLESTAGQLSTRSAELEEARSRMAIAERRLDVEGLPPGAAQEIARSASQLSASLAYALKAMERLTAGLESSSPGERVLAAGTASTMGDALSQAKVTAEHIGQLTQGRPGPGRSPEPRPEAVPLSRPVTDALARAESETRLRATLERDLRAAPPVGASEAQVKRLVTLLVTDAVQALPTGDPARHVVRVSVGTDEQGRPYAEVVRPVPPAGPPGGSGTPWGATPWPDLADRKAAARSLGGTLEVREARGGTAARLAFPAPGVAEHGLAGAPPTSAPDARAAPASAAGRILLVDDEPLVGAAVRRMLGPGYDVEVTTSAAEALARLRQSKHVDLVICDLVMPGLCGMGFAGQLSSIHPALADSMLFMSSGLLSPEAQAFVARHERRVLRKPFERATLRLLVEGQLASRRESAQPRPEARGNPSARRAPDSGGSS
jgi:CheY-like chemotaxis protein